MATKALARANRKQFLDNCRSRRVAKSGVTILPPDKNVRTLAEYSVAGAYFNPTECVVASGLTEKEWMKIGRGITHVGTATDWWIGDWIIAGSQAYGKRAAADLAVQCTGYDKPALIMRKWICKKFNPARRVSELSFWHHCAVATLPENEADESLRMAVELGLTSAQLKKMRDKRERKEPTTLRQKLVMYLTEDVYEACWRLSTGNKKSFGPFVAGIVRAWLEEHEILETADERNGALRRERIAFGLCPMCGKNSPDEKDGKKLSACRRCLDLNNSWDKWKKYDRKQVPEL